MPNNQMGAVIDHVRRTVLVRDSGRTDGQLLDDYLRRREESALAALVYRHGPMVWGVCSRVLRNHHDAEDAFQATFLVLVRKAASVAPRDMVANWLYGVAHQTALKARATTTKKRAREKQVNPMPEAAVIEKDLWHDLQPLLDQELSRLPDIYRIAIVLCDLEGKTRKEAAQQLGVPDGTVAARLARGRVMLAKRLARRGIDLSAAALAFVLAENAASASAPAAVMDATIHAADLFAAGDALAAGAVSTKVAALTDGVLHSMLLTKLKAILVVLLATMLLTAGASLLVLLYNAQAGDMPAHEEPRPDPLNRVEVDDRLLIQEKQAKDWITADAKKAIADGLEYLAKNQAENGSWGTGQYQGNLAITALAGRAFLAAGHKPGADKDGTRLTKAITHLLAHEDPQVPGFLSKSATHAPMYEHAFAVHFLAEAYPTVTDKALKDRMKVALTRAVKVIVNAQNNEGGWRYRPTPKDADVSVTSCQMHALAAAKAAGFDVPKVTIDNAVKYICSCQDLQGSGGFRYTTQGGAAGFPRSAAAISSLRVAGFQGNAAVLDKGTAYLQRTQWHNELALPASHYFYGQYYAARAMKELGGKSWETWYAAIRNDLVTKQRKDGSWEELMSPHFGTAIALIVLQSPKQR